MASSFRRDKLISIMHDTGTGRTTRGEHIPVWTKLTDAWASKDPILGNEFFLAEQAQSDVKVKFRTDYISGVTDLMQIVHGSETYEIVSAIDVKSQGKELLMYCRMV